MDTDRYYGQHEMKVGVFRYEKQEDVSSSAIYFTSYFPSHLCIHTRTQEAEDNQVGCNSCH